MANEKATDLIVAAKLKNAGIPFCPNGSLIPEIKKALKSASKKGNGRYGYPEFVAQVGDFLLVIEDKADSTRQAKYIDDSRTSLLMDTTSVVNYAENGAVHYATHIVRHSSFTKVFAIGCSGEDGQNLYIRPIFVSALGCKLLPRVLDFSSFSTPGEIKKYYNDVVLGRKPVEQVELEDILKRAGSLHEALRDYGNLGDHEKPLVVSALLLALSEDDFDTEILSGDDVKTDGMKIYDALSAHMDRVHVGPADKKARVLNQFLLIRDRPHLSTVSPKLGKSPLRYFAEYLQSNIMGAIRNNTPEDVLGRFYGEFMSYSGGNGQTLGVVLTPKHITELFADLAQLKVDDKVFDPCCGTAGFLIAAMHCMLALAENAYDRQQIRGNRLHGIELRDDMFSIATTNMILRGDGKSNLVCGDFFKQTTQDLRRQNFTVGFMNPPYSQGKKKVTAELTELKFIRHLLDGLADGARCVVIVPQSVMVGKSNADRDDKRYIYDHHTLEGVVTLNPNTFYGVGTNPVIAVFTAHQPHPADKLCKFVNFKDDGYKVFPHLGLMPTGNERERKKLLLDCWLQGKSAPNSFIVRCSVGPDDEWLHSFFYFNEEIPSETDFEKAMADYLTFEFDMVVHGRGYLFEDDGTCDVKTVHLKLDSVKWDVFEIRTIFEVKAGKRLESYNMKKGTRPFVGASDANNGITNFLSNDNCSRDRNVLGVNYNGSVGEAFYHPYEALFSDDVKRFHLRQIPDDKYVFLFLKVAILQQKSKFAYGYKFNAERMERQHLVLPRTADGKPDYSFMRCFMQGVEAKLRRHYYERMQKGRRGDLCSDAEG